MKQLSDEQARAIVNAARHYRDAMRRYMAEQVEAMECGTALNELGPTTQSTPVDVTVAIVGAPTIATISPSSGSTGGGGTVTITGTGLMPGSRSVKFGAVPASVTATTVIVTAPAEAAGTVEVTVTVSGVSATKAAAYTYGTPTALPPKPPQGGGSGSPVTLPGSRPAGTTPASGTPNPLPGGR